MTVDIESRVALFLFAHQDDEFAIFQQLLTERARGNRVVCIYFTTGVPPGGDPQQRNRESLQVLSKYGIGASDIVFAGAQLGIADGHLVDHVAIAARFLGSVLDRYSPLAQVYLMAWEGGHPDHDVLHAIAVHLLHERDSTDLVWQFSLYHGARCPGPLFRVLAPLSENGEVSAFPVTWRNRWRFLQSCLAYPSQRKTWLGLFPFVAAHYLLSGRQKLQRVALQRVAQPPHAGNLYYEKRRFATWEQVSAGIAAWRESHADDAEK